MIPTIQHTDTAASTPGVNETKVKETKVNSTTTEVQGTKSAVPEEHPPVPMPSSRPPRPAYVKPAEVPAEFCERWICFQATHKLDEAIQEFEKMLGNELLLAMFENPSIARHPETRTAEIYFQVRVMRKDLFASLMMNVLEALRARHSIAHGTLVV
jgi:hypothetical protein